MSNISTKKKVLTLASSLLIIFILIGIVSAADVGYILKSKNKPDKQVLSVFREIGLTYDLIEDGKVKTTDLTKYKLIFIGDERLRNTKTLPIYNYPTVIMNGYHGFEWGLTSDDGLSQLSADKALSVKMTNNGVKQVYTKANDGGRYLFYYYMDDNSRLNNFNTVARTWAGIGNRFSDVGDAIAVAPVGTVLLNGKISKENMCFFGLVESKFWTEDAKQMFKDCIGYVGVTCSQNSDCGNEVIGSPYCKEGNVFKDTTTPVCEEPGNILSRCVNQVVSNKIEDCEFGCANGICKPQCSLLNLSNCVPESFSDDYCKEGNVVKDHITPSCSLTNTCLINNNTLNVETCPFGCLEGECIVQCTLNSECGINGMLNQPYCKDNKVYDKEAVVTCNYPGTKNSFCTNATTEKLIETCGSGKQCSDGECKDIICNNNAECGADGFLNQPFCKDSDIFDKYKKYTCNNPGTAQSSCTDATEDKLLTDCPKKCADAQCVTCTADSDCNDNNSGTEDKCTNPGTPQSKCENPPIKCSTNLQCGTDGFTGNKYCLGGASYEDFTSYACKNPGTSGSSCTSSVKPVLRKNCESECINGECITCFENNDCGIDGFIGSAYCSGKQILQDFKTFTCNNPGTPESSCSDSSENKLKQTCPGTCFKGQCKDIKCNSNIDCDDNDLYTDDKCNNPGTTSSYCSHTGLNCVTDRDCGVTGFSGNEFCMIDNVFKMNYNSKCIDAGTVKSYCDNSVTQKLIVDCGRDSCDSYGPNYCKNGNLYHSKTCYDRGCGNQACFANPSSDEKLVENCAFGCDNGVCNQNSCLDTDLDGYDTCAPGNPGDDGKPKDCNDNNANIHPNAIEICNGIDDDCDGLIDENNGNCPIGQVCQNGQCLIIHCNSDLECNDNNAHTQDKCLNPGTAQSTCSHTPILCLNNLECGTNGFLNQLFCKNNNVFDKYITYTCNSPETILSTCSSSLTDVLKQTCAFGCTNGQCNQNNCVDADLDTYDTCNPGTPGDDGKPKDCNDNNANIHPGATEVCNQIDDNCNGQIDEGGVCVIVCTQNLDCNINQFCEFSSCGFGQGTCVSMPQICPLDLIYAPVCGCDGKTYANDCLRKKAKVTKAHDGACAPIICNKNSDCGADGLLNQLFCKNGNVFDKHITYTCNNPGTAQSFCSNSLTDALKQTCGQNQVCSNGQCVDINIPCSSDAQCNDNNAHTQDKCNNPGTPQSFCSHTSIVCLNNLECGVDGYVGGLFCQSGNVFQNYETYTCHSPGTIQSSCSVISAPQLKQTCAFGCTNGQCNQNNCVDADLDTYDTCNPGTPGDDGKPKDCNDNNANIHPGATEVCNQIDDNCNGQIDEGGVCVIVCSTNLQCGTDGFLNQAFCKDGNVFDKYITYTCLNPGTQSSSCTSSISDKLKKTCPQGSGQETKIFTEEEIRYYHLAPDYSNWYGYCSIGTDSATHFCIDEGYTGYTGTISSRYIGPILFNDLMLKWVDGQWKQLDGYGCDRAITSLTCYKNIQAGSTCENGECVPIIPPCQHQIITFSNHQIYYGANSKVAPVDCSLVSGSAYNGNCNGGYNPDMTTANKLCQLKSYYGAVSYTTQSNFFASCNDNFFWKWNGNSAEYKWACTSNIGIDTVTCEKLCL